MWSAWITWIGAKLPAVQAEMSPGGAVGRSRDRVAFRTVLTVLTVLTVNYFCSIPETESGLVMLRRAAGLLAAGRGNLHRGNSDGGPDGRTACVPH
jgi:hypothetical protein